MVLRSWTSYWRASSNRVQRVIDGDGRSFLNSRISLSSSVVLPCHPWGLWSSVILEPELHRTRPVACSVSQVNANGHRISHGPDQQWRFYCRPMAGTTNGTTTVSDLRLTEQEIAQYVWPPMEYRRKGRSAVTGMWLRCSRPAITACAERSGLPPVLAPWQSSPVTRTQYPRSRAPLLSSLRWSPALDTLITLR